MATKRTIDIDIKNNANKTAKDIDNLNKSLKDSKKAYDQVLNSGDSYEKQLKDIDSIVKKVPLNVRDMNKQIQAYQSIALSAGRETPVGQEALKKAADLKDRYIDIQNETKRLADDHKNLRGAMEIGTTVVAGFGAVQGAIALTGVESEKLRETMTKLMAAQTILNGLQQIGTALEKESAAMLTLKSVKTKSVTAATAAYGIVTGTTTGALKLFRLALISTGIGAIVVGIGLLIANFDKLLIPLNAAKNALKSFGDAIGLTNFKQEEAKQAVIDRSLAEKKASIQRLKDIDKEIAAIDSQAEAEKRLTSVKLRQIALDQAKAKSTQEVVDLEKQATDAKIALNNKEYNDFVEKQKLTLEKHEEEARLLQGVIDRNIARGRSDHTNEVRLLKARKDIIAKLNNDILTNNFNFYTENQIAREEIEAEGQRKVDDIRKAAQNQWKAYAQERLSISRQIEDIENSLLTEGVEKELEINEDKFRRLREDAKKNTKLTRKERARLIELFDEQEIAQQKVINQKYVDLEKKKNEDIDAVNEQANQDRIAKEDALFLLQLEAENDREGIEIANLQKSFEAKYALAVDNAELMNDLMELQETEEAKIRDKFRDEKTAKDKAASDKKIADIEAERIATIAAIQEGFEMAQKGADATQALGDAVFAHKMANVEKGSKEEEELARKQFKFNKALQLGGAIIDAGKAITASLAQSPIAIGPVPNPAGIASLAFAATTSAANIAQIAASKFDSPGSGSTAPSPSGVGGGGEPQAPQFNVVGDSSVNQLAQLQQQPVQAFVVSGEVTTSQALDRNRVENATL